MVEHTDINENEVQLPIKQPVVSLLGTTNNAKDVAITKRGTDIVSWRN